MSKDNLREKTSGASTELAALLKRQSELAALEKKRNAIEAAIAEQNEKIDQARAAAPSMQRINALIGDLLASEAAGLITTREREQREGELNKEAAKVRAAEAEASVKISRIHATISGLEAQRRDAKAAIMKARCECHEALCALLLSEAEHLGREYLECAKGVYARFNQLMAIDTLHRQATGVRYSEITRMDSHLLYLPAFQAGGDDALACGRTKSRLFNLGVEYDLPIAEALEAARSRFASLGVNLTYNSALFCDSADADEPAEQAPEELAQRS